MQMEKISVPGAGHIGILESIDALDAFIYLQSVVLKIFHAREIKLMAQSFYWLNLAAVK